MHHSISMKSNMILWSTISAARNIIRSTAINLHYAWKYSIIQREEKDLKSLQIYSMYSIQNLCFVFVFLTGSGSGGFRCLDWRTERYNTYVSSSFFFNIFTIYFQRTRFCAHSHLWDRVREPSVSIRPITQRNGMYNVFGSGGKDSAEV